MFHRSEELPHKGLKQIFARPSQFLYVPYAKPDWHTSWNDIQLPNL
jgi:hypothetical protein